MKSKIVLVIAMLLLVSILAVSTLFIINASSEYEEIVKEESKQNEKEETPPKEDDPSTDEPPTDKPEDSGEGGDPIEPTPVVKPMLDGHFSDLRKGAYVGGYRWVKIDQYEVWQPITGDGSNDTTTLFRYGGAGYWFIENQKSGWASDAILIFSNDKENSSESLAFGFYYQLCINGVWQDELLPMDGTLFSAYIHKANKYGELNDFSIHKATRYEPGRCEFVLDGLYKFYVSIGLTGEWDSENYTAVNFYCDCFYMGA